MDDIFYYGEDGIYFPSAEDIEWNEGDHPRDEKGRFTAGFLQKAGFDPDFKLGPPPKEVRYPNPDEWGGAKMLPLKGHPGYFITKGGNLTNIHEMAEKAWNTKATKAKNKSYGSAESVYKNLVSKRPQLSEKEQSDLAFYAENGYALVNEELRGGKPDEFSQKMASTIDSVIERSEPISESISVFRGLSGQFAEQVRNAKPGHVISDPAFLSTTTTITGANKFAEKYTQQQGNAEKPLTMAISVPKGAKAVPMEGISRKSYERELLFARGSRLKVLGPADSNGVVPVELLPASGAHDQASLPEGEYFYYGGMEGKDAKRFEESKHPRDKTGEFTAGSGSKGSGPTVKDPKTGEKHPIPIKGKTVHIPANISWAAGNKMIDYAYKHKLEVDDHRKDDIGGGEEDEPEEKEAATSLPRKKLTSAERAVFDRYFGATTGYANGINEWLRGGMTNAAYKEAFGGKGGEGEANRVVRTLTEWTNKSKFKASGSVYRAVGADFGKTLKAGSTITAKGFTSSTESEKYVKEYAKNQVESGSGKQMFLTINYKAGQSGLSVGALESAGFSPWKEEHETLFPRNSRFKVSSVSGNKVTLQYLGTAKGGHDEAFDSDWPAEDKFEESKHPRDKDGQFATGTGTHGSGLKLTQTKQRAWQGSTHETKTKLSKLQTGALGENIAISWLKQNGLKDASALHEKTAVNFPLDLVGDHEVYEIKTGLVSNNPKNYHWRASIGEPGEKEKAWLRKASPEEKAQWNAQKMSAIISRKEKVVKDFSKKMGKKLKGRTIGIILNPDTGTADIHVFDGFHMRIGWVSEQGKKGFVGTYKYEQLKGEDDAIDAAKFEESKHPRDKDGEFVKGSGNKGGGSGNETALKKEADRLHTLMDNALKKVNTALSNYQWDKAEQLKKEYNVVAKEWQKADAAYKKTQPTYAQVMKKRAEAVAEVERGYNHVERETATALQSFGAQPKNTLDYMRSANMKIALNPMYKKLSMSEGAAIIAYTAIEGGYKKINKALREGKRLSPEQKKYIDLAISGLNKLPVAKGTLYRSIMLHDPAKIARYKPGTTITENGFTSCCDSPEFWRQVSDDPQFVDFQNVKFTIKGNKSGRDLGKFGAPEVTYAPGASFKVLSSKKVGNKHHIMLQEVARRAHDAALDDALTGDEQPGEFASPEDVDNAGWRYQSRDGLGTDPNLFFKA